MNAILLYDSADATANAVKKILTGQPDVSWLPVDVSASEIAPCIGCFGCWVRTPGECVLPRDAGGDYYRAMHRADMVVTLSRVTWGGYSVKIKAYTDRLLPLLHPNFRIVNGEMHHKLRYGKMPTFISVGFGARNESEEETFRKYVEAQRDQSGTERGSGCLLLSSSGEVPTDDVALWFRKEAAV